MKALRYIFFPLGFLYILVIFIRNKLYDWGLFSIYEYDLPVISVGNLSMGGTGKTPHMEYIIRLLKAEYNISTLSRGYGRKTPGFILAGREHSSTQIGDEPRQYKRKFSDIIVAVENRRARGIELLRKNFPNLEAILLDDAFQHRSVKAGLSLLLTDYSNLFSCDYILPYGNLREFRSGASRADAIIITKTPPLFSPLEKRRVVKELNALPHQRVFFSYVDYGDFIPFRPELPMIKKGLTLQESFSIVLLTGIANPLHMEYDLRNSIRTIVPLHFEDHHEYTTEDLKKVSETFHILPGEKKIVLTTEKDYMRLDKPELKPITDELPFYFVPIEVHFHDTNDFDSYITSYVARNTSYKRVSKEKDKA